MTAESPPHLRVLLDTSCLSDARAGGGIGRYARQLRRALGSIEGLDVMSLELPPSRTESRPGRYFRSQVPAIRSGMRRHPHLVHGVGGEPVLGFPLSRQVVTLHDIELWRTQLTSRLRWAGLRAHAAVQGRLLRGCAAVIAVSEVSAAEATDVLHLDPTRVHVVPSGVGRVFSPTRTPWDDDVLARHGLSANGYLIWTGSMRSHDPRKALDLLIEAVGRVPGATPLVMVGARGEESMRIAGEARRRGAGLIFTDSITDADLAALYRNAACAVIPSRHEGFGLTALEAMACGCAVVSTDGGNLATIVGGAGVTVPAGDAGALARAITEVLTTELRREGLRERGLTRASEYSWAATAAGTARVYRSVARELAGQRRSAASASR